MTQTRQSPLATFDDVQSQLARLLDGFGPLMSEGFTPLADLEETEDSYVVELELPGVDKDDVDITIAGRRVTVQGERKERERQGILRRRTRTVGRFRYEVVLPGDIDDDNVTASMEKGVLTLRIPKASSEQPRHITVR